MDVDPLNRLENLRAEYEADQTAVEADLAELEQKQNELERKREELRQLVEGMHRLLSSIRNGATHPQAAIEAVTPKEADSAPLQNGTYPTSGSPQNLSRRQLILQIIPEFHGSTFTASEVRERFVNEYLEVEPLNFPQAINGLLKRMADRGEIEQVGRKGSGITAPWLYREKNQEEALNLGP